MNLLRDMLIEWIDLSEETSGHNKDPKLERVLWIDPSASLVILIDIFDEAAFPIPRTVEEIKRALEVKEARVQKNDPYAKFFRPEHKIKEKHKKKRDQIWEAIKPLLEEADPEYMLYEWKRGPRIRSFCEKMRVLENGRICRSRTTVYKYHRRWWQTGRRKNAFLPNFDKCGAPGKRRLAETQEVDEQHPKVGRRSALAIATGKTKTGTGIRITADIERKFEKGIKIFYENTEKRRLPEAFEATLRRYFHIGVEIIDGAPTYILPPDDELPTLDQFRYWYETRYRDVEREKRSREGNITFELTGRELLGNSRMDAFGPGSQFQIDATISDAFLISASDTLRIIGRAVFYDCIDVFSNLLTGYAITLEGPSWLGAMLALDNVAMDKVTYCAEYGIEITEEEWPCHSLPDAIIADRGEFEGYDADTLVNSLGISVHNTAAWRADWKGIIERHFGIAKEKFIRFIPGSVPPRGRSRGDPDYDLKAAYTLNDLRKVMICHALRYNMTHYMESYPKQEWMIPDHVERYPLDIWEWGIRNRSGRLGTLAQEIVRLNLLPRKLVWVTPAGIHFEGDLYFTCELAIKEKWFTKARNKGSWRIEVCFDLRTTDHIYIPLDGGMKLETCWQTAASKHLRNRDWDWYEAMDYFALEEAAKQAGRMRRREKGAWFAAQKDKIDAEAVERLEKALRAAGKLSKSARRAGRRENRQEEKMMERQQNAWRLGAASNGETREPSSPNDAAVVRPDNGDQEYVPRMSRINRIREIRNKEWRE
jgi:putative transposase